MSNDDDYPTEEELDDIEKWPYQEVHALLDFIGRIWWAPDWGWREFEGKEEGNPTRHILASTGGWSGNEDIMAAFRRNYLAYSQCFVSYRRGGHYELSLPKR